MTCGGPSVATFGCLAAAVVSCICGLFGGLVPPWSNEVSESGCAVSCRGLPDPPSCGYVKSASRIRFQATLFLWYIFGLILLPVADALSPPRACNHCDLWFPPPIGTCHWYLHHPGRRSGDPFLPSSHRIPS